MRRIENLVKKSIKKVEPYRTAKRAKYEIGLMSNENNYGPSPKVMSEINKIGKGEVLRYPDPFAEKLKAKIAKYAGVGRKNVAAFNGADEGICDVIGVFAGEGDEVLACSPTFPVYKIAAAFAGAKYVEVKLNKKFELDEKRFLKKFSRKTKVVVLCNPNNPTGKLVPRDKIESILKHVNGRAIVVVDEAYYEYSGKSMVRALGKYRNLVILRSFSKAFGLAGLRLGYAIANEGIVKQLMKMKRVFNVGSIAQKAGVAALSDLGYMRKIVKKTISDRERLFRAMSALDYNAAVSGTNFLFVDVSPKKISSGKFVERLLKKKVLVREIGKLKGFKGDYVRITIGTEKENQKLISALEGMG